MTPTVVDEAAAGLEAALATRAAAWDAALRTAQPATVQALQAAVDGPLRRFDRLVFYGAYLDATPRLQLFGVVIQDGEKRGDYQGYLPAPSLQGTEAAFAAVREAHRRLAAARLEACIAGTSDDWLQIEDWPESAKIAEKALLEGIAIWLADCWASVRAPACVEALAEWGVDPPQVYDLQARRWR